MCFCHGGAKCAVCEEKDQLGELVKDLRKSAQDYYDLKRTTEQLYSELSRSFGFTDQNPQVPLELALQPWLASKIVKSIPAVEDKPEQKKPNLTLGERLRRTLWFPK